MVLSPSAAAATAAVVLSPSAAAAVVCSPSAAAAADMHQCFADMVELFHAYFCNVAA